MIEEGDYVKMVRYSRLYLTAVLIMFTLLISGAIGLYDYYQGQQQIRANHEKEIEVIENSVVQSLHVIDQMYHLADESLGETMKENMDILMEKYHENPSFGQWDFQQLKNQFGMDIYIIDHNIKVIYSSFEKDVGLDFAVCCGSLADTLEERLLGNEFKHDGMDLHQITGEINKFAYMPTPDNKYLFELSMPLEDGEVFQSFNILKKMDQLVEEYKPIHSIRLYNPTGLSFNGSNAEDVKEIPEEMRPYFDEAKRTSEKRELVKNINGQNVTYRYIPYQSIHENDYPMRRIVEIVYNEVELEGLLKFYREGFLYQQLIILFAVVLLSIFIGRIIAKPIHLAFHDSLTNLRNRAAFEIEGERRLKCGDDMTLMMIDVDNFKEVNDQLGHSKGDCLLVKIAKALQNNVQSKELISRIGGDEFVIICSGKTKDEMAATAELLLHNLNEVCGDINKQYDLDVSISIGIAYAEAGEELRALYDKADQALYQAKRNGKNQYAFYENMLR